MIPLEGLSKFIDFCQIIREFGGSLLYDHDEWIELRKVSFSYKIYEVFFFFINRTLRKSSKGCAKF